MQAVGFSLGVLEFLPTAEEHTVVGHLGPDLLGPDWDADRAVALLREQPDRRLREALLDQRNLAGLGTMWMAETCFLAGEDPSTPVAAVRDLPRLVARSQALLRHHRELEPALDGVRNPFTPWNPVGAESPRKATPR